jgi:tRNA(fMet)-specific endonuclease VapC
MAWLLDTNAWITYLKMPQSSIRSCLETLRPADVLLCSVVKAELLHGAEKYGNRERRLAVLRELFAPYVSLAFDDAAASAYGRIRHELETAGNVIGPNDLMIAAIALAGNHTLVTHNTAEFSRVSGLALEDWQKKFQKENHEHSY